MLLLVSDTVAVLKVLYWYISAYISQQLIVRNALCWGCFCNAGEGVGKQDIPLCVVCHNQHDMTKGPGKKKTDSQVEMHLKEDCHDYRETTGAAKIASHRPVIESTAKDVRRNKIRVYFCQFSDSTTQSMWGFDRNMKIKKRS